MMTAKKFAVLCFKKEDATVHRPGHVAYFNLNL